MQSLNVFIQNTDDIRAVLSLRIASKQVKEMCDYRLQYTVPTFGGGNLLEDMKNKRTVDLARYCDNRWLVFTGLCDMMRASASAPLDTDLYREIGTNATENTAIAIAYFLERHVDPSDFILRVITSKMTRLIPFCMTLHALKLFMFNTALVGSPDLVMWYESAEAEAEAQNAIFKECNDPTDPIWTDGFQDVELCIDTIYKNIEFIQELWRNWPKVTLYFPPVGEAIDRGDIYLMEKFDLDDVVCDRYHEWICFSPPF